MVKLSDFDGRLLDGFSFCKKVYALFDQVAASPDGAKRLRVRDHLTKKLVEELLPLAHHVQSEYREGRRLKIRWTDGSQTYDAEILSKGVLVDHGRARPHEFVEVTCVMHENEHLNRELLHETGFTFGVRGISRDRLKKITSKPHAYSEHEADDYLLERVLAAIKKKNAIKYPDNTVLIIKCYPELGMREDDWQHVVDGLRNAKVKHQFAEIFVCEPAGRYNTRVY